MPSKLAKGSLVFDKVQYTCNHTVHMITDREPLVTIWWKVFGCRSVFSELEGLCVTLYDLYLK